MLSRVRDLTSFSLFYSQDKSNQQKIKKSTMSRRSVFIRFYVDDSELSWNHEYFKGKRGHDPRTDPHKGLFQNHHGKFDLHVFGDDIVSMEKTKVHSKQRRYQMDSAHM